MKELYAYLMTKVFRGFIERDGAILQAIDAFEGDLEVSGDAGDTLVFTLPALFEFVRGSYEETSGRRVDGDRDSYLSLRKALYGNPTNRALKAWGAHVVIDSANRDHDLSTYKLLRDHVSAEPPTARPNGAR